MKLYELKSGQKFKLLNLDEVLTFEKVDGMCARVITPTGELDFIHWSVKPRGLARGYKRLA